MLLEHYFIHWHKLFKIKKKNPFLGVKVDEMKGYHPHIKVKNCFDALENDKKIVRRGYTPALVTNFFKRKLTNLLFAGCQNW